MAFSLACDDGTTPTVLRIEGADTAVTWNDIWEYGAGGGTGTVTGDANGDATVSDFLTEHIADAMYQIHKDIEFGDGTNSLEFLSRNESVYFDEGQTWQVEDNTTLELGELYEGGGINGSMWQFSNPLNSHHYTETDSEIKVYGSVIENLNDTKVYFFRGIKRLKDSIFKIKAGSDAQFYFGCGSSTLEAYLERCSFLNAYPRFYRTPALLSGLRILSNDYGVAFGYQSSDIIGLDVIYSELETIQVIGGSSDYVINVIDPVNPITTVSIETSEGTEVNEQYTINALVRYNGSPIQNATVKLYDKDSTEVFSVLTDINGQITEQSVTSKKWTGTSETETDYNDFTLEISHADYPTYTQSGITLDEPIDWEIEMPISSSDLLSALTTDDTKWKGGDLDAAISSRAAPSDILKNDSNPIFTTAYGSVDVAYIDEGNAVTDYLRKTIVLDTMVDAGLSAGDNYIDLYDQTTNVQEGDIIIIDANSSNHDIVGVVTGVSSYAVYFQPAAQYDADIMNDVKIYSGKAIGVTGTTKATEIDEIKKLLEADWYINTTNSSQWVLEIREKGTSTVLLSKNLKDVNGNAIASTSIPIGRQIHV